MIKTMEFWRKAVWTDELFEFSLQYCDHDVWLAFLGFACETLSDAFYFVFLRTICKKRDRPLLYFVYAKPWFQDVRNFPVDAPSLFDELETGSFFTVWAEQPEPFRSATCNMSPSTWSDIVIDTSFRGIHKMELLSTSSWKVGFFTNWVHQLPASKSSMKVLKKQRDRSGRGER